MASNDEYVYEVIDNEKDARVCAELLAEEFVQHNPLLIFEQVTAQRFCDEFVWPALKDVLDERLSFLARHRLSGEIVGASVASDLYLMRQKHPFNYSDPPAFSPVVDLIDEMNHIFLCQDFDQELKPNMVLCIGTGATRAQHTRNGVGSQLRATVCQHARDTNGFQYAVVQVAHPGTRHIYLKKMGGKEMTINDLTTWVWKKKGDGICPYKDFKGEPMPNILLKLTSDGDK
jgi:hypothetical protein